MATIQPSLNANQPASEFEHGGGSTDGTRVGSFEPSPSRFETNKRRCAELNQQREKRPEKLVEEFMFAALVFLVWVAVLRAPLLWVLRWIIQRFR